MCFVWDLKQTLQIELQTNQTLGFGWDKTCKDLRAWAGHILHIWPLFLFMAYVLTFPGLPLLLCSSDPFFFITPFAVNLNSSMAHLTGLGNLQLLLSFTSQPLWLNPSMGYTAHPPSPPIFFSLISAAPMATALVPQILPWHGCFKFIPRPNPYLHLLYVQIIQYCLLCALNGN